MLSMTSDYAAGTGCPEPYLRRIAEAGFSHVHWCHHWSTDFLYSQAEIDQIKAWLDAFGLAVTDLHGSAGVEKRWGSTREYERQAGVELVENRIDMTARLGADVVIMHAPGELVDPAQRDAHWPAWRRSLDRLCDYAGRRGVRIALENGFRPCNFDVLEAVFKDYEPERIGLCYDSGHGNIEGDGLDRLDRVKDRLISVHLHDNDGAGDQHLPPLAGTIDWERLGAIVAASSYAKWVSLESAIRETGLSDESVFLRNAFEAGTRVAEMFDRH